jgi:hypothetical protein
MNQLNFVKSIKVEKNWLKENCIHFLGLFYDGKKKKK